MGHIRMMAAVQPFLSGAISKTVNVPRETTVEEIRNIYVEGWKLGLKAVAVYRDGSKRTQPVSVQRAQKETAAPLAPALAAMPNRRRLPATRPSITHKFDVANHEGYLNVGLYEDGTPGELFVTMSKEGSTVGGMMDAFATAISLCLQYGVPLEALVRKFTHQRFEPSGMTTNREIPFAKSIVDYVFRWLGLVFLEEFRKAQAAEGALPADPSPVGGETAALPPAAPEDKDGSPSAKAGAEPATGKEGPAPVGVLFRNRLLSPGPGGKAPAEAPAPPAAKSHARAGAREASPPAAIGKAPPERKTLLTWQSQEDAPPCPVCETIMIRNGNCYKCPNCASTSGCN